MSLDQIGAGQAVYAQDEVSLGLLLRRAFPGLDLPALGEPHRG